MKRIVMITYCIVAYTQVQAMDEQESSSSARINYTFKHAKRLAGGTDFVTVSPDSAIIVSGSAKSIEVYHMPSHTRRSNWVDYTCNKAVISPDNREAALRVNASEKGRGFVFFSLGQTFVPLTEQDVVPRAATIPRRYLKTDREASGDYCWYLDFTPDSRKIITSDGTMTHIINYATGTIERKIECDNQSIAACFVREGALLTLLKNGVGKRTNLSTYNDLTDVTYTNSVRTCPGAGWGITTDVSAERIGIMNENRDVSVHDIKTGNLISKFCNDGISMVGTLALSPNGKILALDACEHNLNGRVYIIDIEKSEKMFISFGKQAVKILTFSPDSRHILVISNDGKSAIFDVKTAQRLSTFTTKNAQSGEFFDNGSKVVIADKDDAGGIMIIERSVQHAIDNDGDDSCVVS